MPRPEETLDELARLAREDEALHARLPAELSTPISAEKTAALVGAIQSRITTRARRRQSWAKGAALAALAAGVLFFVGRPGAPLPAYDARVDGGQQRERSSGPRGELLLLRPSSTLRFELRPRTDYTERVTARVTLRSHGEPREPLELPVIQESSPAGALKVEARLPAQLPERGELVAVVERAGSSQGAQRFSWPFERSP